MAFLSRPKTLVLAPLILFIVAACGLGGSPGPTPTHAPYVPRSTSTPAPTAIPTNPPPTSAPAPPGDPSTCNAPGGCATFIGTSTILIGTAGPMTGDNSNFGMDSWRSARLATKDAGTLNGHPFGVSRGDDQGVASGAVDVANSFISQQGVVAVMGHSFSTPSARVMALYAAHYIPMMSGSATRVDLTQQGSPSFNRLVSADDRQALKAADFLANVLGAKNVVIIQDNTLYGQSLAQGLRTALTKDGVKVAGFQSITPGSSDYSSALNKVAALKPDAVYYSGFQPEAAVLAKQRAAAGLTVPFMSGDGVYGKHFVDLARGAAEGYYMTQAGAPLGPARDQFDAAYKAAYSQPAGLLSGYPWFYYDATMVLIQAVRQVAFSSGDTLYIPRQKLMQAVRQTSGYQGITGTVTCDATGECAAEPTYVVFQVQNGTIVQLPADYKPQ